MTWVDLEARGALELGPVPRPRRSHRAPQVVLCRWFDQEGPARELEAPYKLRARECRGIRRRPEGLEPELAVLDCGAPGCQARTVAYAAELAAGGARP